MDNIYAPDGIDAEDWAQIQEWNDRPPTAVNECLHDLIHRRAVSQPDSIALCAWDGQLTYGHFDLITTQVASFLAHRGVLPGDSVPICFEKSKWAIVSMIAILKAGAAFVPFDPSQPGTRLKAMVGDLRARCMTASTSMVHVAENLGVDVLVIDQSLVDNLSVGKTEILPLVTSSATAFIMFTSGSTGKPSAVVIKHSAMATALHSYASEFGFHPESRVMQFSAYIWLPCTVEIVCNLVYGGRICIPSEEARVNNAAGFMREHEVNMAVLTPTFLGALAPEDVPTLQVLGLGGEKIPQAVVNRWAGSVKLILAYGSTETNIAMLQTIEPGPFEHMAAHSTNSALWIVDSEDPSKLAPIGQTGELIIESWSLASEYLHDEQKTAVKFIDSPEWLRTFRSGDCAPLCKVGDLARYHSDGTVEVLGRKDSVIKIRGQRLEPSDVEWHLRQLLSQDFYCAVQAVSLVGEEEQRLAAFIASVEPNPSSQEPIPVILTSMSHELSQTIERTRNRLEHTLPQYMLPSLFVGVKNFPLSPSGKPDRQKLKALISSHSLSDFNCPSSEIKRLPSTPREKLIASLWSLLLGIPEAQIGLDDNFFRLGGDSMKSIKLVSESRKKNVALTVVAIFKNPKLGDLALVSRSTDDEADDGQLQLLQDSETSTKLRHEVSQKHEIMSSSIEDIYPPTSLQEGLLSLTQKKAGAYIVRLTLRLPASLNVDLFRRAWELVWQRNAILRTRIMDTSSGLMQVVLREDLNWSAHNSLEDYISKSMGAVLKPGDRLSQYTMIDDSSLAKIFVWTAHHALFDAWSVQKILQEVESFYLGRATNVVREFKTFIQYLSSMNQESQRNYWKEQLTGASKTNFPQLPSPTYQPSANAVLRQNILFQRNSNIHITSATIVRAAWGLLLALHSDTNDVVFGATLNGRTIPVPFIEDIVGPTITTVPVRISIDYELSKLSFLQNVQSHGADMIPFEQYGLSNIGRLSREIHDATKFETLLLTRTSTQKDSLRFLDIEAELGSAWESLNYALIIECTFVHGGASLEVTYDSEIIPVEQVSLLMHQFEHIIQQLCAEDSTITLRQLNMSSIHDNMQIRKWNNVMPESVHRLAHDVFHDRVLLHPHSIAVDAWDGQWTFEQLDLESERLAWYFSEVERIGPEDIVPVCFNKSKWAILAMLAIWKAGGGFAPIDAGYPNSWIETVFKNAHSKVVLMSRTRSDTFTSTVHHLVIDDELLQSLPASRGKLRVAVEPTNISYVIHTSGSTGVPKGIVHSHTTYVSGALIRIPSFGRHPNSRVIQFASFSFDVCMDDIWTSLLGGATVCVPSDDERSNDLVGYMNRARITNAEFTPSLARTFKPSLVPTLRLLTLSGEPSNSADRDLWANDVFVLNEYGPAEISIKSHSKHITMDTNPGDIGFSVACLAWIVNAADHNILQPIGGVGELLLEGPILSRGYLNKDAMIGVYIDNPKWLPIDQYGPRRLYKTGDLARYSWDGSMRLLGRKDKQVKLRGQRIELGQIEHEAKKAFDDNLQAIVDLVTLPDTNENGVLVVFVSESTGTALDDLPEIAHQLDSKLPLSLPSYMVPSAVAFLDYFPKNMSGKIDRKKLQEVASKLPMERICFFSRMRGGSKKEAPSTDMESRLQSIWAQCLNMAADKIGKNDNFFRLGGDSILAMKLVSLAARHDEGGIVLTVENIFRSPILSEMALLASQSQSTSESVGIITPFELANCHTDSEKEAMQREVASLCSVTPEIIQDIYPTSPLQEAVMAISVKRPGFYMSQFVFYLLPTLDLEKFSLAVELVFDATATLRSRVVQWNSTMLQVVLDTPVTRCHSDNLADYLSKDTASIMGLGQPLVRYAIIKQETGSSFVFTLHHALYDGWSLPLLLNAVRMAYEGEPGWNPRLEYVQFINYLASIDQDSNVAYWRDQFDNGLQSAHIYPQIPSPRYTVCAESSLDYAMKYTTNPPDDITMSTMLRAAWTLLESQYTDSDDLIFGVTLTGRNAPLPGIAELVGPVFTTLPLRVKFNEQMSVSDFLHQVQDQATEMMPFEHYSLQKIRNISPDARMACNFQTLIVVQSQQMERPWEDRLFAHPIENRDFSKYNPRAVMVQFTPSKGRILVNVSFDSNIIDELQMKRKLQQLEHILGQMGVEGQLTKIVDIEAITAQDQEEIASWNEISSPLEPVESCIHHLIKKWVLERPESPAVLSWDGELSYRQLHEMSTNLAHDLVGRGIGPDYIVPLLFEKSMWTVVALLGVLKAGGAFVLLDPSHPVERLRSVLHDVGTKTAIVSSACAPLAESLCIQDPVIVSSSTIETLVHYNSEPITEVNHKNLACLVFTSGSSGVPKGIMLEHSAICTSISGHGPALNVTPHSRVFQFASYAFDMAVYDIVTTLSAGALICIPSEHDRINNMVGTMSTMLVNWAFFTPSTASLIRREDVPTLQTLVVGGESVSQDIVDRWAENIRLFQCSGPAETTTCIMGEMKRNTPKNCLGRGTKARCWIVKSNDHNSLASIGQIGELVVEGPTLARGYLNTPSEAWIEDPAWARQSPGQARRIYKCGDLVRYTSQGDICFIGRKDTQIKLRGQRLELTEVEDCLRAKLPKVEVAAEIIAVSGNQNAVLAAFISTNKRSQQIGAGSSVCSSIPDSINVVLADVESYLAQSLPHYMIPSVVIPLTEMPRNSSGKIDRKQLRQLGSHLTVQQLAMFSATGRGKRAPSTEAENNIQSLWAEVLNIEPSDIMSDDHFLRLGGDSIMAMRLVALSRRKQLSLTVAAIFKNPILCDMAVAAMPITNEAIVEDVRPFGLVTESQVESIRKEYSEAWGIQSKDIIDVLPCTALQEGLMTLSIQNPGSYVAQEVYKLPDTVDLQRFRLVCEAVSGACSILRTRIVQLQSSAKMVQVVVQGDILWQQGDDLLEYLKADQNQPIQLGSALTRWAIIGSHFVWTRHHASYDGSSLTLLLKLIEDCYNVSGKPTVAPTSVTNFGNFIKYSINTSKETQEYWHKQLSGSSRTKYPRIYEPLKRVDPRQTLTRNISFPKMTNSSITMSTVLRGTWSLLLSRYTGSSDIVFGATLSGRNAPVPGVESIVGPTFTTIPVRVSLEEEHMSIKQFLEQIQDEGVKMIPHEHWGLQSVKKISTAIRNACDFQSLLVVQPMSDMLGNSLLTPQQVQSPATFRTYAVTLDCRIMEGGLLMNVHFDPDLVDEQQMTRTMGHFETVLHQLLNSGSTGNLKDVNLLTPEDVDEIWNLNANVPIPTEDCVHHLVEQQILQRPTAVAVDAWDGSFTYARLDELSSSLADHLISLGVGPEARVPVIFEKSKWMIVSILGILRAGGAFVPLDPSHPPSRLQALIHRIDSHLVLSSAANGSLCLSMNVALFVVQESSITSLPNFHSWRNSTVSPNNSVYISFTSGSTGFPKAVVIEHAAYCSGAREHIPKISIDNNSRVLQFASHSFDTFFEDVLTTLIVGACIVIPSEMDRTSDIVGVINRFQVNWAHLTPSFANLIDPEAVPSLNVLLLGGEALNPQHARRWANKVHLINVYGPSELCVTCSVKTRVLDRSEAPNIGRPIGGVAWIADPSDSNKLSPVGVVGELLFEGPIMSRGYLKDPEKTSEAFIDSPTWLKNGTTNIAGRHNRLYKTGDLVCYGKDGDLVYVGRKDAQIKLRGQRIELGEVEHHIKDLLDRAGNVAVEMITTDGIQALAAFISLDTFPHQTHLIKGSAELEHFNSIIAVILERLSASLPVFMLPTYFIPLGRIPLSISKKVDRHKLKTIAADLSPADLRNCAPKVGKHREPKTELEREVQHIWSQCLNRPADEISLNTSFFGMGGDSISAMQILSRLRQKGIMASLLDILRFQTIASFCAHSNASSDYKRFDTTHVKSLAKKPITGTFDNTLSNDLEEEVDRCFPLSPIQHRFFDLYPNGNNSYQLSHLLSVGSWLNAEKLSSTLESIVQTHSMLRARFSYSKSDEGGVWQQRITNDIRGSFDIKFHQESNLEQLASIISDSCHRVDIQNGPLLTGDLITTPHEQVLYLTAHHLVLDLVSWRIILQDLEILLGASTNSKSRLQRTSSYPSWCLGQEKYAQTLDPSTILPFTVSPVLLEYWGLSNAQQVQKSNFITKRFFLDQKTSSFLLDHCFDTLKTQTINVLLASVIHSFNRVFRDRDDAPPVITNVSHGRHPWDDSLDVSRTVGWFTTMYPLQVPTPTHAENTTTANNKDDDEFATTLSQITDLHTLLSPQSLSYFASRYLSPSGKALFSSHSMSEIAFNYAGIYQQLERKDALFREMRVANQDPSYREVETRHSSIFEIVSRVQEGRLGFGVSFPPEIKRERQEEIEKWVAEMERGLGERFGGRVG